jgi:hypothetical protein
MELDTALPGDSASSDRGGRAVPTRDLVGEVARADECVDSVSNRTLESAIPPAVDLVYFQRAGDGTTSALSDGSRVSRVERQVAPSRMSRPRLVVAALAVAAGAVATACTPHHEALSHPCPTVLGRGVIALAKVGLSGDELKLQEKC